MDNDNFVNIDDLVRQRLGGGEERERSGAWLQMRELLDEEMPQRRGFVYWRRMLSASAVLLLIATISVGGYELSATRNGNTPANNDAVAINAPINAGASKSTPKALGTPAASNETNNNITSSGTAANVGVANTNSSENKKTVAVNINSIDKQKHNQLAARQQKGVNHTSSVGNTAHNNDSSPLAANDVANKENNPVAGNVPANKSVGNSKVDNHKKTTTLASTGTVKHHKSIAPSAGKPAGMNLVDNPAGDDKPVAESTKKADLKITGVAVKTAKKAKMKELALASHPLSVSHPKALASAIPTGTIGTVVAANASAAPGNKLPLSSHAIANKNGITAKVVKVAPAKVLDVKSDKKIVSSKKAPAAVSVAKSQKTLAVAGNVSKTMKPASGIAGTNAAENITKNATAASDKREKRVMQKLVLVEQEHYIKTDPGNGHFNLDTISMKTITQELAAIEENNPAPPAEKMSAERKTAVTANNSVAGSGNSGSTSATVDPQILPGASASSNGKPAMGQKATSATGTGAGALGSLESAFNDVKYNVKGVQFAAGLTAGINGTFFGPSSFNGFQFGVTGDFAFSNEWSFASELKYFQRANNNYSLNDNYTTYAPNSGGGYTMTQTTNSYSFTALHSLEMPLIVRYTNGKFNFFVGGNLVYSFSINEGYAQQTPVVTTTPSMGSDTQPKINPAEPQSDFNSRFGVGCLFGISYKIAPNFNIDLRNVMTLWDNASSQGAKYVSDQVYKSPSLQLSLGYRLGNNKHKE